MMTLRMMLVLAAIGLIVAEPASTRRLAEPVGLGSFGIRSSLRECVETRYLIQGQLEFLGWSHLTLYPYFVGVVLFLTSLSDLPRGLFVCTVPIALLEARRVAVRRRIDRGIVDFLDVLNARMIVCRDVLAALDQCASSLGSREIAAVVCRFNLRIRLFGDRKAAFAAVSREVHHDYLRYIFMNIEHISESWGGGLELLREIQHDYISIQTEHNRSRTELENDRWITYFGMFLVLYTASQIVSRNPAVSAYFGDRPATAATLFGTALIGAAVLAFSGRRS